VDTRPVVADQSAISPFLGGGVVIKIFTVTDDIFFSVRSSSNSFYWTPRKPLTDMPEDSGTGIRPLHISIARTLADHARRDVSLDKTS